MTKVNPKNERHKHDWLKELERDDSPSTIDHKLAALACFEEATDCIDFDKVTVEAVDRFIEFIIQRPTRSRTNVATVNSVKTFFQWMVMDERIKGTKSTADCDHRANRSNSEGYAQNHRHRAP